MALPNELQIEDELRSLGGVNIPPTIPTDNFQFTPSESWWDAPQTQDFSETLDPAYLAQINHYKPVIEQYAPSALANGNSPYPGEATGQYDPLKQITPADMKTAEGAMRSLDLAMKSKLPQGSLGEKKPQIGLGV